MDIQKITTDSTPQGRQALHRVCTAAAELAKQRGFAVLVSCSHYSTAALADMREVGLANILTELDDGTPGLEISLRQDGLATVRLTNNKRRNPLCKHLLFRMRVFLRSCAAQGIPIEGGPAPKVKTILLASTGPVFCSGHDFADFCDKSREEKLEILTVCAEVNMLLNKVPQVTIAAVDGLATAGGCQLAASCDLVYASRAARFCLPGARGGAGFCHTPAVALADRMPSQRKALEMALMAEEVSSFEAEKAGLCNQVIDGSTEQLEIAVDAVASKLCRWFGPSLAQGKQTFYEQSRLETLEDKYKTATPVMADMFAGSSFNNSMREFLSGATKKKRLAKAVQS